MLLRLAAATLLGATLASGLFGARAEPVEAEYRVSQSGLPVMDVQLAIHVTEASYRLVSVSRALGLARLFLPAEQRAEVHGGLAGREVQPFRYIAEGNWRGGPRRTVLDYFGGTPQLSVLEPPAGGDRIPVPPALRQGTVDTLSALMRLSLDAAATGRCDLAGAVFDGRRRLEWRSRTLGTIALPLTEGQPATPALRCQLESRLVAGFRRGEDQVEAARPREAEAWVALFGAGLPPMPVKVEFPSTILGSMRLDLVRVGRAGP